jgi:hypothetical protein
VLYLFFSRNKYTIDRYDFLFVYFIIFLHLESNEKLLSPWLVDMYCNNGMETALHAAVGAKQHEIAAGLVNIARANVNLSTRPNTGDQVSWFLTLFLNSLSKQVKGHVF